MKLCPGVYLFSSRTRHTGLTCDWSSVVCSSDLISSAPGDGDEFGRESGADEIGRQLCCTGGDTGLVHGNGYYHLDAALICHTLPHLSGSTASVGPTAIHDLTVLYTNVYRQERNWIGARSAQLGTHRAWDAGAVRDPGTGWQAMEKAASPRASDIAYDKIRQFVLSGRAEPGQQLTEEQLARISGVS